jgi:cardiolipin synthase
MSSTPWCWVPSLAARQAMFERDLAGSERIELAQGERRPLAQRMKEQFARLWAYWL